ncbi:hypothetical protein L3V83_05785 [Thiotrichales bacterium 19X7-9]|nr:hypothetical protein [Thiotrichales bacterium 19X7-9]
MKSQLVNIKKDHSTKHKNHLYSVLSKVFDDAITLPLIDQLLDQSCFLNQIEFYFNYDNQVIGFNSFRTFKLTFNSKTYYISRGFSNIAKGFRGNKTAAIFIAKSVLKVKFKTLFSNKKHYFFFIASGIGNFYSSYKYLNQKLLYPDIFTSIENEHYKQLAQTVIHHFDYQITDHNPIKIKDPYVIKERLDLNFNNKTSKEKAILSYFRNHSQSSENSLITMVYISWQMIFSVCLRYLKIKI